MVNEKLKSFKSQIQRPQRYFFIFYQFHELLNSLFDIYFETTQHEGFRSKEFQLFCEKYNSFNRDIKYKVSRQLFFIHFDFPVQFLLQLSIQCCDVLAILISQQCNFYSDNTNCRHVQISFVITMAQLQKTIFEKKFLKRTRI